MTTCANTVALNRYLRTVDQEERRLTAIEDRAASLLLTDYSTTKTDNVMEALQEVSEPVADAIAIHLGHVAHKRCAMEKGSHYEMIGRLVAGMIDGYWARHATQEAERQIDDASCRNCYDAGCRLCREHDEC